jgi:hypothetical protein
VLDAVVEVAAALLLTMKLLEGVAELEGMTEELTLAEAPGVSVATRTSVLVTVWVKVEVTVLSAATSWVAARQSTDETMALIFILKVYCRVYTHLGD